MEQRPLTIDEKRSQSLVAKTIRIDESDVKSTNDEQEKCLLLAIRYYFDTLLLETDDEMSGSAILRLFGLWFSNINNKTLLDEIEVVKFTPIPTYKFIALMPQITAHLSTDGIKDVIQSIVGMY